MTIKNYTLLFAASVFLFACQTKPVSKVASVNNESTSDRIGYDDSTLYNAAAPYIMPYNRIINPAGTVVNFGDTKYENHSLDCELVPGQDVLAVEDRYGVTMINTKTKEEITHLSFNEEKRFKGLMSTYSGIKVVQRYGKTNIFWSAANASTHQSVVMMANWDGEHLFFKKMIAFKPEGDSPLALPNELFVNEENGVEYLYVVLNGNNQFVKMDLNTEKVIWKSATGVAPYGLAMLSGKAYVTNWGGSIPTDTAKHETAGVPYGHAYINHTTGATSHGSVSVFDSRTGQLVKEIGVGLHPNAIVASPDRQFLYVANGNSDNISVIDATKLGMVDSISVKLDAGDNGYIGDSPNALAVSPRGTILYVANGLDNAVAVVKLGANVATNGRDATVIQGFVPTEAYPGGLAADENNLYITNLEGEGARVKSNRIIDDPGSSGRSKTPEDAFNAHHQDATVSIVSLQTHAGVNPLAAYTKSVKDLNLMFRGNIARLLPRKNVAPQAIPERIGEPSLFKHVIYIIKENRTYDQVLGDMKEGNGSKPLCIYGDTVTPNQHKLAKDFLLMDNYYASGKSSAEGHQWTDQAMVNDYVEKNVRAWFRSYPHTQTDAMVYGKQGFIWNNALDHGKNVRIYGETATPVFDEKLNWANIYQLYRDKKLFKFSNYTTISRVRPILSASYPGYDNHVINDQMRADAFIKELNEYENKPGDSWPQLMIMALPADHTGGLKPGLPTPRAMVADNDLALGRIIEAVTHSRFYDSTVVFVTEDDSQDGWDHVSAYRTTGFVISKYSRLQRTVHTNYNQTCMVRSIEQILGIPPMNIIDATALPMYDCFKKAPETYSFTHLPNIVPLDEMNKKLSALKGTELYYATVSLRPEFKHIDGGNDDLMNRMLWYAAKRTKMYPGKDDDGKKDKD
jgi:DNA-binding beta-propeller fold protein YncE